MADIATYPVTMAVRDQTFNIGMAEDGEEINLDLDSSIRVVPNTDYNDLSSKPQIEGITLEGNKTFEELTLEKVSNAEIEALFSEL